jgi:hypothetical protein
MQIQSFGDVKTNLFFRAVVLVMLAMAISGCHRYSTRLTAEKKSVVLPVPDTQFQSSLGRTALVIRVNLPGLAFLQIAHDKGAIDSFVATSCSGGGATSAVGFAVNFLFDVGCSEVATSSAEIKAKTVQKLEADLAPMLANNVLQESLRDAVEATMKSDGIRLTKVQSVEKADKAEETFDYGPLAAKGVDTVLEVSLSQLFNEPAQGRKLNLDPRLPLEMRTQVRLIRTRDNSMHVS